MIYYDFFAYLREDCFHGFQEYPPPGDFLCLVIFLENAEKFFFFALGTVDALDTVGICLFDYLNGLAARFREGFIVFLVGEVFSFRLCIARLC